MSQLGWNHDKNEENRTVATTLTSISAPSYTTLATPVASDWGNAAIGASLKLSEKTLLWAAFSEVFGNAAATGYGGELGLGVRF